MRKAFVFLFIIQVFAIKPLAAQSDLEAVKRVISGLFEGMKTKNPELMLAAFHEQALMHTVIDETQETNLGTGTVKDFINRIATTPVDTQFEERILDYQINIDGHLASVWTPYEFFINNLFSHCGVNSFQLIKIGQDWKITYVIDTRRKVKCISP